MDTDKFKNLPPLKKIDMSKIPNLGMVQINNQLRENQAQFQKISEDMYKEKRRIEQREEQKLEYLKNIDSNTASLVDVVTLLRQNNEHQVEIKELIFEILSIAVLESEPEVQSRYEKWRKKAADLGAGIKGGEAIVEIGKAIIIAAGFNIPFS